MIKCPESKSPVDGIHCVTKRSVDPRDFRDVLINSRVRLGNVKADPEHR